MRTLLCILTMLIVYQFAYAQCGGFVATTTLNNNVTCHGLSDGSGTAYVTGGQSPYSYIWDTGEATATATSLVAANHTVSVMDANACVATTTITITEPPVLTATIFPDQDVTCPGNGDGAASVFVNGGTPPYIYEWQDGQTTQQAFGLWAGFYIVTITDANNCTTTADVIIVEPAPMNISVQVLNDVTCNGAADGAAEIFVNGGVAPYTVDWANGQTGFIATSLVAGTYQVWVTDANGCSEIVSFTIVEPTFFQGTVNNIIDADCLACNGAGTITAVGGVTPYSYVWSNGSTTQSNSSLCAGIYVVTLVDANGCTFIIDVLIEDNDNLEITGTTVFNDVSCTAIDDGSAAVTASGGTAPYVFQWSNGETTQTASNLESGSQAVTVTGANGCSATASVVIQDTGVDYTIDATNTSCNTDDGTASIIFTAPVTNPAFNWSNGETTQSVSGLAADWYSVTVENTDTGCRSKRLVEIIEDPTCFVTIEGYVYLDDLVPDCAQDAGTMPFPQKMLMLSNGVDSTYTFTDSSGYYSFEAEAGNYTVRLVEVSFHELACAGSYTNAVNAPVLQTTYQGGDFYLKYVPNINLSTFFSSGPARPGFTRNMWVYYCNYGSDTMSGTFSLVHDQLMTNFNGNGLEDSYDVATSTVEWSYTDLAPGECFFKPVNFYISPSIPIGTLLCDTSYIEPLTGDIDPSNNTYEACRTVTGSYDPNDKQNLVGTDPFGGDIYEENNPFLYQIRFQNTGTDTAFTVVVKDTLSAKLNIESINVLDASHDYSMRFTDANILEFWFENIMLPDSNVNEPASNGFVLFSIEKQPNLPIGTTIENTAGIYFDFNSVVLTNTVVNTLALPPSGIWGPEIAALSIAAYPNPASASVTLDIDLPEAGFTNVSIYDYAGKLLADNLVQGHLPKGKEQIEVPTSFLQNGIYFMRIQSGNSYGVVRVSIIH